MDPHDRADEPAREELEPGRAEPEPRQAGQPVTAAGVPWGMALFLVLAVLLVVFAVQNTQDVELNFFGWSGRFPLVIIIVTVFVTSVLLDQMIVYVSRRRRRRRAEERAELKRLRSRDQ